MARVDVCSRYKECSEKWDCVNSNTELREGCGYGKHLKNGINFYNKGVRNRTYLELFGRLFYVGTMNHKSTRSLNEERRTILEEAALPLSDYEYGKLVVDQGTETEWCNCIVTFNLQEVRYVIWNFNIRALKNDTAVKVRDWFRNKGMESAVVTLGKPPQRSNTIVQKPVKKTPPKKVVKEPFETKKNIESAYYNLEQVDMFNLLGSSK